MNIETANQVELELDDTETVVEVESKNIVPNPLHCPTSSNLG